MQTTKTSSSRLLCLLLTALMALSLAACGSQAAAPMSEEEYQTEMLNLMTSVTESTTAMEGLSGDDQESIDAVRELASHFEAFAAIDNPPEAYAEGHAKIAEGCQIFADIVNGLCDEAEKVLAGTLTEEEFNANMEALYAEDLTRASDLLSEGFAQLDEAAAG